MILLLNLPAKDYLRTQVIDLLSSPYFQLDSSGMEKVLPRPDMWDLATRELAICKGIQEWRRLQDYTTRDLILSQVSHDDEPRVIRIAAAQIRGLANIFNEISIDLEHLAAAGFLESLRWRVERAAQEIPGNFVGQRRNGIRELRGSCPRGDSRRFSTA